MRFSVLGVGTELTTGQIANTNAQWISKRLQEFGAPVSAHLTVPDDRALILAGLETLAKVSEVIFVTGGLGPTSDDFTRELVAQWTEKKLIFHQAQFERLQKLLSARNLKLKEGHKQECFFPDPCVVLNNPVGTANGFWVKKNEIQIVVLPGPPKEIEGIWYEDLQAPLQTWMKDIDPQITASWDCQGLPESEVSSLVEPLLSDCPFEKAYRVHLPFIEFKLTYPRSRQNEAEPFLRSITETLKPYTGGDLFSTGNKDIAPENILYFDYCSTTPCDPQVVEAMNPYFLRRYGNSINTSHGLGLQSERAVESSRKTIAQLLKCKSSEIYFTSGSTESNNSALRGVVEFHFKKNPHEKIHILTAATEHKSVLTTLQRLQQIFPEFLEVTVLPVRKNGCVSLEDFKNSVKASTKMVALMWVNNELGAIHPIDQIATICEERKILLHVDATQAIGKVSVQLDTTKISSMAVSAHKIYGPKGVGLWYIRDGSSLPSMLFGGGHERGQRAGTLNVPGIVGFAKAFELIIRFSEIEGQKAKTLRQQILQGLRESNVGFQINGDYESNPALAVPHILSLTFEKLKSAEFQGVAYSKGSACTTDLPEMSHVLSALHFDQAQAEKTFRFCLGRSTRAEDCQKLLSLILKNTL